MVFSSYIFIFAFLPVMLAGFYGLKYFNQNFLAKLFLVLGSLFFYAFWEIKYLGILLFSIFANYGIALLILKSLSKNNSKKNNQAKFYLYFGIFFNLALLGFFKYTDFFLENFNLFSKIFQLDFSIPLPHILLPLAISFFTFQQIAFLVDCYKKIDVKDLEEDTFLGDSRIDFLDYCLFVSFFPQLIAGPIVHHKEMMPQFQTLFCNTWIEWDKIAKGVFIFSIGLFKKVFIADSFAKWANNGFSIVENGGFLNMAESWVTSLSYTFQLYFDFSGYCDMAIGLGLFFGIFLPINFNSPYKSLNITEFWRKWHITLGKFLKDYLYIPLGGNKGSKILTLRNLFIVAFLSGIWHGAGFGFVIWGALHGIAMCLHRAYGYLLESFNWQKSAFLQSRFYKILCWFLTFNFLNLTWIFFRAENLQGALNLLQGMFGIVWVELPEKARHIPKLLAQIEGRNETLFYLIIGFIVILCAKNSIELLEDFKPSWKNVLFAGILFYVSIVTLSITPYVEFIYFNF